MHKFIKTQRKIARRSAKNPDIGYFTYDMLCKMRKIYKSVSGENPDKAVRGGRRNAKI